MPLWVDILEIAGALVVGVLVSVLGTRLVRRRRGPEVELHVAQRAAEATEDSAFTRILVPTRGTIFSDRMVSLACKLARRDEAEVEVLYVVEIPLALPATAEVPDELARAGEALSEAEIIARTHGIRIRGRVAKARFAGKAIVDLADREGIDLIILGVSPLQRHGDWGRTVDYVFRNAACDVIVERPAQRIGPMRKGGNMRMHAGGLNIG